MSQPMPETAWAEYTPDITNLITEDDTPGDNIFSEKSNAC
jgi:hypothetical protein